MSPPTWPAAPAARPPSARAAGARALTWTAHQVAELAVPAPMTNCPGPDPSPCDHPRLFTSWGQMPPWTPPHSAIPTPATSSAAETFSEPFGSTQDIPDIARTYPSALLLVQDDTLHVVGQDGTVYFAGPDPAYGWPQGAPASLMGPTRPHVALSAPSALGGALSERYGVPSPPPQEMARYRGKPRGYNLQPQQDHPHVHQSLFRLSPAATAPPPLSPADFAASEAGSVSTAEDMTRYFGSPTPSYVAPSVVFPVTASRTAPVCGVSRASQSRGDDKDAKSRGAFSERPSMAVPAILPMRASPTPGAAKSKGAGTKLGKSPKVPPEDRVSCSSCEQTFSRAGDLERHVRNIHGQEPHRLGQGVADVQAASSPTVGQQKFRNAKSRLA